MTVGGVFMGENQLTCKQRILFIFYYYRLPYRFAQNVVSLGKGHRRREITSQSVRELGTALSIRLERIAGMLELLESAHNDWQITGKKDRILMETDSFEFNQALEILSGHGFIEDDYVLRVEYERKWGIL